MRDRPRGRTERETVPEDPVRALLDAFAQQADLLAAYLERVYDEAYLETADQRGRVRRGVRGGVRRQTERDRPSGPERSYVLRTEADGTATIRFGDGVAGRRPGTGTGQMTVTYRRGTGGVSTEIARQPPDSSPAGAVVVGVHRGMVVDATDPLLRGRLQVRVPGVLGEAVAWALPAVPTRAEDLPAVGNAVWILFEAGDPHSPVWLGAIS